MVNGCIPPNKFNARMFTAIASEHFIGGSSQHSRAKKKTKKKPVNEELLLSFIGKDQV